MPEKSQPAVAAVVEESPEVSVEIASGDEEAVRGIETADDPAKADSEDLRAKNRVNVRKVGAVHGVAVVAALTLFGAAQTWAYTLAEADGWLLAGSVAVAAAFIAGIVLSSISHEWGHYTGAVVSGSRHTVAKKPIKYFFMFNFDMPANSVRQALSMSWGGLAGSWLLVAALAMLVPMDSWSSAVLLATVLGQAVNASVFEVPIILRTRKSREFESELSAQLESPGIVKVPGLIVGLLAFAVLT